MTSHIKVMHKLDLMGIGAGRNKEGDEGGQGKEFEKLLRRLNESGESVKFEEVVKEEEVEVKVEEEAPRKKKKRKHSKEAEEKVDVKEETKPETSLEVEVKEKTRIIAPRPMAYAIPTAPHI